MLILDRKLNESIDIDGPCRVHIKNIGTKQIKIGIEAPPTTTAVRTEVLQVSDYIRLPTSGSLNQHSSPSKNQESRYVVVTHQSGQYDCITQYEVGEYFMDEGQKSYRSIACFERLADAQAYQNWKEGRS